MNASVCDPCAVMDEVGGPYRLLGRVQAFTPDSRSVARHRFLRGIHLSRQAPLAAPASLGSVPPVRSSRTRTSPLIPGTKRNSSLCSSLFDLR